METTWAKNKIGTIKIKLLSLLKGRCHKQDLKNSSKLRGNQCLDDREYGIDPIASVTVAEQIKQIYTMHVQIAVVIGEETFSRYRGL